MKVLITGISGQDGAYLTSNLLDRGMTVYGTSRSTKNLSSSALRRLGIYNKVKIYELNLLDFKKVMNLVDFLRPDWIFNLASQSSVGLSFSNPHETIMFNSISVLNILETIKKINDNIRFYQASSSEMFGNPRNDNKQINENTSLNPISPYGISKASAHMITKNYRKNYGIFACTGIMFNHESALRQEHFVTKKIVLSALKIKKNELMKMDLGDLSIRRDWGYAPDYVKAMELMIEHKEPEDFIICSGKSCSLEEYVNKVFSYFDLDYKNYISINNSLFRKNELKEIYGNNSKARKILGWKYDKSLIELTHTIIKDEIIFQQKYPGI